MGKGKKIGKNRQDKFYKLAKEQGYRARSAFKLVQLNKKYDFLAKSRVLIDLCAAPGGWLQVAEKYMPVSSVIVGVDLVPIKPIRNVITLVDDITTDKCRQDLKKELKTWKADVVLHDGSPNMGQSWLQDAYTQADLTLKALKLATEFLVDGGIFLSKVFRSKDYNALLWVFNQLFKSVEVTKPSSSRNESAEIYVMCRGFLAPKRIDPKLLDPRMVFMEVEGDQKIPNIFMSDAAKKKERKKPADGYDQVTGIIFKTCPAAQFMRESYDGAVAVLATHNQLTFEDDASREIAAMPDTTEEVRLCCQDLKVLGRKEFRALLKWKATVQKELERGHGDEGSEDEDGDGEEQAQGEADESGDELDENERLDAELASMSAAARAQERRKKKKVNERKAKLREKLRLKMVDPEDRIDMEGDESLFSLRRITKGVEAAGDVPDSKADEALSDAEQEEPEEGRRAQRRRPPQPQGDVDDEDALARGDASDEDEMAKYADMEDELDAMYEAYLATKDSKGVVRRRAGKKRKAGQEEQDEGDEDEDEEQAQEEGGNPLLVDLERNPVLPASKRAKLWFDQPLFKGVLAEEEEDDDDDEAEIRAMNAKGADQRKGKKGRRDQAEASDSEGEEQPQEEESEESDWSTEEEDSESETELVDEDGDGGDGEGRGKARKPMTPEQIALATLMLSKKKKQMLLDDAYNRNAFNDDELPEWFEDDEKRHRQPNMPVTKEAMKVYREKMREIDARPIKKVAEAKARKKHKLGKKMERLKKQATAIADSEDISERQKLSQITKLYKSKLAQKKTEVKYVVAKGSLKGRARPGVKGKYRMVDPRLKKDKKAQKRIEKRAKQGRRK